MFSGFVFTLLKSTVGFLPRHKFDKHQTALRTIVKRVLRVKMLQKKKRERWSKCEMKKNLLTSTRVEECQYRERSHDTQDCHQRCYQEPKQPTNHTFQSEKDKELDFDYLFLNIFVCTAQ